MDLGLAGRTAYVTGGARGIGAAIVDRLLAEGARVAISDADGDQLEANRARWGDDAWCLTADLSGPGATTAAEQALDHFDGELDIVVNNVGASSALPFEEIDDARWQQNFDLNFMSHVRASRALLPTMARRGGAAAVFIASDLAKQPELMPVEYATAKAGILNLAQILSLAYAPAVRVNAVCPGPIWTDLWTKPGGVADGLSEAYGLPREEAVEKFVSERHLPLGIGEPDDVAALVLFLVSPVAKFITAAAMSVDGGGTRSIL